MFLFFNGSMSEVFIFFFLKVLDLNIVLVGSFFVLFIVIKLLFLILWINYGRVYIVFFLCIFFLDFMFFLFY